MWLILSYRFLHPPPHVVLSFTTGNAWNMTGSEYNASIHLQVALRCIVWLILSYRFLLPPPHVVLPFTTGNAWNMTACGYNASIHMQVTLCCIVWLLLSCRFLLPPPEEELISVKLWSEEFTSSSSYNAASYCTFLCKKYISNGFSNEQSWAMLFTANLSYISIG